MKKSQHRIAAAVPLLAQVLIALASGLALRCEAADAAATAALYQVEVPLRSSSAVDRTAAFGEALREVAVRVSGDRNAGSRAAVAAAVQNPARYVQQYGARSNRMLRVGFDPRAIETLVLQAGLPVWPAERPSTLVLLYLPAVAGGNRAVLSSERPPEREQLEAVAALRGIALAWPLTDIGPAAADEPASLAALGAGGSSRAVLVGTARDLRIDWRLVSAGDSKTPVALSGTAGDGAHLVADALAARYAPPSTRDLAGQSVVVGGIVDLTAYAGVLDYLRGLSLVRSVEVDEAQGETLRLSVTARGDRALLRSIVALGSVLSVTAAPEAGTDFVYVQ